MKMMKMMKNRHEDMVDGMDGSMDALHCDMEFEFGGIIRLVEIAYSMSIELNILQSTLRITIIISPSLQSLSVA